MFKIFKKFQLLKTKSKNIVVIVDEDFYPKNENPHLENALNEKWEGELIYDMINNNSFVANKNKYYEFYTKIRDKYKSIKPSSKYHKSLINIFEGHNLTIINLGLDESFERVGFKNVLHPKGINSQLICSTSTFGCGKKFRFKKFNSKTVCSNPECKQKTHLKPNIDFVKESSDFDSWNNSKLVCENADMIIFFGSNCHRTIVNSLLNLNSEVIKVEVAPRTSDTAETEFHYVVLADDNPTGIMKLSKLLPRYLSKK